jgi:uncharacterized protein (TIGR04255 family)
VIYAVNPLDEVICQLRFPPILRIDAEPPAAFQELIRADYPNYELKAGVKLPPGIPSELAQSFAADFPLGGTKSHVFGSRDGVWKLTLNRQAMALTCGAYERWERFKERLAGGFDALMGSFAPAFFSRIGLRYRDVIRRSELGLQDVPWGQLLKPWVSGVLGASGVEAETYGTETVCGLQLPDTIGRVQLRFGIAIEERPADNERKEREEVFMIDSDFFEEKETEPPHVINRLNAFHEQAGRLFRWCIADRLHDALRPGPVPPL